MDNSGWIQLLNEAKKAFVLFSGGKDSSAALVYTKELISKMSQPPTLVAIHIDTTIGLPETQDFIKDFCKRIEVELEILKPRTDYFTLVKQWGVPRPRARWCCFHLKIQPIRDYLQGYSDYVVLDGIRRQESRKRSGYPAIYQHPHFGLVIHPIIDWSDEEVNNYLEDRGLPLNPVYELGFSSWECWCGIYKRKSEFEKLKETYPKFFAKLVELESQLKSGFAYAYFNGKPFYLKELTDEKKSTD